MAVKGSQGETLAGIGDALRKSLVVPTDTMITDEIPLLLTKLSALPAVADGSEHPVIAAMSSHD